MRRGTLLGLLILVIVCALFSSVLAADPKYPTRPIESICPFPPGGSFDTIWRVMTELVAAELGKPLVVVNKPGAGGMTALAYLVTAKPDGYTICQSALIKLGFYMTKIDFKDDDNIPIIQWGESPHAFVVKATSPWKTMKDVVEYAKKNPGKLKVGHIGRTNTLYLTLLGIARQENIKIIDIPYAGDMPMLTSLLNGDINVASGGYIAYANRDDVRVIMTAGKERISGAPNVLTYKETFGKDPVVDLPVSCVFVPKGTPDPIIKVIHDAFRKAMQSPRFKEAMVRAGQPIVYRGTSEIQQFAVAERERVLSVMKQFNMIR